MGKAKQTLKSTFEQQKKSVSINNGKLVRFFLKKVWIFLRCLIHVTLFLSLTCQRRSVTKECLIVEATLPQYGTVMSSKAVKPRGFSLAQTWLTIF